MCLLGRDFVETVLIEPSLGFLFTQTGFACAKPLKKIFDTNRRQFVNLLGNACTLSRLLVVHTIAKVALERKLVRDRFCTTLLKVQNTVQRYKPNGSEQRAAKDE